MEKPILFNTEMVQAILEGRKTSTRRIIKLNLSKLEIDNNDKTFAKLEDKYGDSHDLIEYAPYHIGDILYIRETFCPNYFDNSFKNRNAYKADYNKTKIGDVVPEPKWHPSIHMPKEAARIFLKVTDVKVQRVQDITEDEARAEGIRGWTKDGSLYKYCVGEVGDNGNVWRDMPRTAKEAFSKLWDNLYHNWNENPWVWVIEFERVKK